MSKSASEHSIVSSYEIISDQQQKAYLHPVRMKILGFFAAKPMTISQVATGLEVHPANITHHFRNLEQAELIQLTEERDVDRVVERYYSAIAQTFNIRPPKGNVENVNAKELGFLRNDLSAAISNLKTDDADEVIGLIRKAKINPKQYVEFARKLEKLIEEFGQSREDDGESYALNVSLYLHRKDYGPIGRIEFKKKSKKYAKLRRV